MTTAKKKVEAAVQHEQKGSEFAKQLKERNRKKSDGGLSAVTHTVHSSRKQEAAASKEVARPAKRRWKRASLLPAMPDLPGKHLEYVRRDNRNRGDQANLNAHLRSGWEFARTSLFEEEHLPTQLINGHGECIGNDDTVLMMIDEDMWAERNAEYEGNRDATTAAVNDPNQRLDVSHPDMPLVDVKNLSTSEFAKMKARRSKRSVSVASD